MRCMLLFAGTPVGRVTLDGGEPAAGFLEPWPAYERVAPVFRRAGNALWQERFLRDRLPGQAGRVAEALADAAAYVAQLALATEAGTPLTVDAIDLWDSTVHGEPPFVLASLGAAPAAVPARIPPATGAGSEGGRPAA